MSEPITEAADKAKLEKIVQKDEKTGRTMSGFWAYFTSALFVFMVGFYMYNAGITPVAVQWHRGIYVLITYVLIFVCYPLTNRSPKTRPSVGDLLLAGLSVYLVGYWMLEFEALNYRMGSESELDFWVSLLGILVSLEVARRVLGFTMALMGLIFMGYCYLGPYLPDIIAHRGFSIQRIANYIYLQQDGVFGIMADVLVTYVILFIFFGAFLKKSGAGQFFLDLPLALAGGRYGGPAKVAVIASGFFGSVSGSAIANTVSTGAFTIPLMKRAGFRPHVAGAIEPAASIGGMFMPPIMGAGGFLMAELTGTPYSQIMLMAFFPAFVYFLSVYVMVHYEAKRYGLITQRDPDAPTAWQILKKEWFMSLPLVIIVVMMLIGFSPGNAAFWATLSCVGVSWLTKDYRMGPRQILEAMIEGGRNTLIIGATVGVIGMIVGAIALTGIGLRFSEIIISLSGGNLIGAILLVGIASLVLGMGVPVTAAYLITAVLAVPALSGLIEAALPGGGESVPLDQIAPWALLASHMIVYWFSQDSNITPPVCVAAYAGAAIAGSDPWKTGWTSFKFAKMLYVGPFLFAFAPGFLLFGHWEQILFAYGTIILGTIAFGSLTMGYMLCPMTIVEWVIMAVATLLLFFPYVIAFHEAIPRVAADILGIGLWVLVYFIQKWRIKRNPDLTKPIDERRAQRKHTEAAA
ncbi:MAG: TRAP transporter permease [Thermodesulfobacteriota bacterium]